MRGPERATERSALDRMRRTQYTAISIAALVFGALLAGGSGGFLAQRAELVPPFGTIAIVVGVGLPASFGLLSYLVPMRLTNWLATAVAVAFVALQLLWVPMMVNDTLSASPWLQGFNAIAAALLATAQRGRAVWLFPVSQGPIVAIVETLSRPGSGQEAVLDGVGALVFCLIITGVAMSVVGAAARQDEVAALARQRASLDATARTVEREESRINAIVHDDIMSVLLAASRSPAPAGLGDQARVALQSVDSLALVESGDRAYSADELVALLRVTVSEAAAGVAFSSRLSSPRDIPGVVAAALSEATGEAIRNSVLHAGAPTDTVARAVAISIDDAEVTVRVLDDGRGFSLRQVAPRRLGIRVSIIERMRSLPGGDALVRSRPGDGTQITLWWRRGGIA
jgi:signal transduction histidine kinase